MPRTDYSRLELQSAGNRCLRCGKGPMIVDSASGEMFCGNCGYVVKEKIEETGPEWNASTPEESQARSRTGSPTSITMHDMGLATVIGRPNRDATGRPLSGSMRSTVARLRTWDNRSQVHESMDRNLRQAFSELDRFAEKLAVHESVIEKAAYIYRKALERGLLRGRSITETISASLYAACRETETPRTLKDIAAVSNVKKKDVARSYRLLLREMDLRMPVADPVKAISRIASKAELSEKTKRKAVELLRKAGELEALTGKDPMGLAAAALYIASTLEGDGKTQKELARAGEITEVTIRNRYRGLRTALAV